VGEKRVSIMANVESTLIFVPLKKLNMKNMLLIMCTLLCMQTYSLMASDHGQKSKGKILMIAANPSVSSITGWPIGCWAAELTHPYWEFTHAGYEVEIVSPQGGKLEFDGYSNPMDESGYSAHDLISLGWIHSKKHMALMENTRKLSEVNPADYAALFVVGGQSPMFTFRNNKNLTDFVVTFYQTGKPTALVCHSTCILLDAKLPNGKYLVEGKK
jgi:putative intracellular protease/amidase